MQEPSLVEPTLMSASRPPEAEARARPPTGTLGRIGIVTWSDRALAAVADLAGAVAEAGDEARGLVALEDLSRLIRFDCAVLCRAGPTSLLAVAAIG